MLKNALVAVRFPANLEVRQTILQPLCSIIKLSITMTMIGLGKGPGSQPHNFFLTGAGAASK
jgi:hypothetical protein